MFTARLPDVRIYFTPSYSFTFNTNIKQLVLDQMFLDLILRTRLRSTGFITQPSCLFHFHPTEMVGRICFVPVRHQLPEGKLVGLALQSFYMIHRVGRTSIHKTTHSEARQHTLQVTLKHTLQRTPQRALWRALPGSPDVYPDLDSPQNTGDVTHSHV